MVAAIGLSLSDAIILAAVLGAGFKVLADYRGWTRSPSPMSKRTTASRGSTPPIRPSLPTVTGMPRSPPSQRYSSPGPIHDGRQHESPLQLH